MSAQRPTSSGAPKPTDVIVEYTQTGAGVPEGGKTGTASLREGSLEARMLVPCANPECKKGGFLLRPKVDAAAQRGESELTLDLACAGYVGPLRSERGPASGCGNKLAARVRLLFGKLGPK